MIFLLSLGHLIVAAQGLMSLLVPPVALWIFTAAALASAAAALLRSPHSKAFFALATSLQIFLLLIQPRPFSSGLWDHAALCLLALIFFDDENTVLFGVVIAILADGFCRALIGAEGAGIAVVFAEAAAVWGFFSSRSWPKAAALGALVVAAGVLVLHEPPRGFILLTELVLIGTALRRDFAAPLIPRPSSERLRFLTPLFAAILFAPAIAVVFAKINPHRFAAAAPVPSWAKHCRPLTLEFSPDRLIEVPLEPAGGANSRSCDPAVWTVAVKKLCAERAEKPRLDFYLMADDPRDGSVHRFFHLFNACGS